MTDSLNPTPITIALFGEDRADAAYGRSLAVRRALRALACNVVDATVPHHRPMANRHPWAKIGLRLVALPMRWWRLWQKWRQLPADTILFVPYPAFPDGLLAALLSRRVDQPLVMDALMGIHDTIVGDRQLVCRDGIVARWLAVVEGGVLRHCDAILVDTTEHARFFQHTFRLLSSQVIALPLGVDMEEWAPVAMPSESSPYEVVFWATGIPLHGAHVVAQAATLLSNRRPNIHFTIIGMGPSADDFRRAFGPEIPQNVKWIHHWVTQREIHRRAALSHCCLGIFGTTAKADRVIPYKVQQALALGRPVITADTQAARRMFTDGKSALLVPPGDARALADAIAWMADNPTAAKQIGDNGHRCFQLHLSENVFRKRLAGILSEVRTRRSKGD